MFTGLVEKIGTVTSLRKSGNGMIIRIDVGDLSRNISIGDSVAVNGVCLTATSISGVNVDFDVSLETLNSSTTGSLKSSDKVNLELAMSANGRFGGHIVQGHVDGIGIVKNIKESNGFYELSVSLNNDMMKYIVKKGSISVSGISLTIASVLDDGFTVAVIPVTWQDTILQYMKPGDKVNIEADLIVKTIRAQLTQMLQDDSGNNNSLTLDKLKQMGFC
ncbi:MAG: riboflavin synthase [Sedimentisphaeraceae bacterium JB056]